nr:hypothetical protein [uncultured Lichenicoccus sp.]
MALLFADRVRVAASAAPGTGTFAVGTAVSAYQSFPASFPVGSSSYYLIEDGTSWELGVGLLSGTGVWTRSTVILTSAGNATALTLTANAVLTLTPSAQFATDLQARTDSNYGRNRIRNPRMQINQRAGTYTTSGAYTADGWIAIATAGTIATTVGAASASYAYSGTLSAVATGLTAGGTLQLVQRIESYECMDLVGQPVTFSFTGLASTSAGTVTAVVQLSYPTSQDSFGTQTTIATNTITLSGTAARVSTTFAALPAGAANGLQVIVQLTQVTSTGNTTLTIGGVQLEPGLYATALEKRPIEIDFLQCERTYQVGQIVQGGYGAASTPISATAAINPMRATPTLTATATSDSNLGTPTLAYVANGVYATATVTAAGTYSLNVKFSASADL